MNKIKQSKQQDIFEAAIMVFTDKGLDLASMEGIAKQANVSKRTLYKYYPNKDALFQEIIRSLLQRFSEGSPVKFDPTIAVEEQLTQLLTDKMEYLTRNDFILMSRLIAIECMKSSQFSELAYKELSKVDKIEGGYGLPLWLEQGEALGILKIEDKPRALDQLISAIKGSCFWPQLLTHKPAISKEELRINIALAAKQFAKSYSI